MNWAEVEAVGVWLAIAVTLGVAIVGWSRSNRDAKSADKHAATADQRAQEALDIARSAEARAERLERQALERRDVAWEWTFIREGDTLSFRNIGTDTAHVVELVVFPAGGGGSSTTTLTSVPPGDRIGMQLGPMLAPARARSAAGAADGIFFGSSTEVHVRLVWRSESGLPDIHEERGLRI